ncbi:unnamed protein product [Bursaphelenchus okinawaensis]|uniref:Uncharacterized protein n=1 Tax=Bursaphelenchus okinawaensis TaxID=465554 RepID=A0A811LDK3_9BILA|nr:unnamed protein product [Bursaphelenchus okinawaensis]CAG9121156.1 unnamed protein product [Bursaphelenchus okinawaensis]
MEPQSNTFDSENDDNYVSSKKNQKYQEYARRMTPRANPKNDGDFVSTRRTSKDARRASTINSRLSRAVQSSTVEWERRKMAYDRKLEIKRNKAEKQGEVIQDLWITSFEYHDGAEENLHFREHFPEKLEGDIEVKRGHKGGGDKKRVFVPKPRAKKLSNSSSGDETLNVPESDTLQAHPRKHGHKSERSSKNRSYNSEQQAKRRGHKSAKTPLAQKIPSSLTQKYDRLTPVQKKQLEEWQKATQQQITDLMRKAAKDYKFTHFDKNHPELEIDVKINMTVNVKKRDLNKIVIPVPSDRDG